ncbi:MAG TPA: hypothetical protein PLT22_10675 [Flexilinea sp.]|nr:hypothetical protein [Flexilinea sp.]
MNSFLLDYGGFDCEQVENQTPGLKVTPDSRFFGLKIMKPLHLNDRKMDVQTLKYFITSL